MVDLIIGKKVRFWDTGEKESFTGTVISCNYDPTENDFVFLIYADYNKRLKEKYKDSRNKRMFSRYKEDVELIEPITKKELTNRFELMDIE